MAVLDAPAPLHIWVAKNDPPANHPQYPDFQAQVDFIYKDVIKLLAADFDTYLTMQETAEVVATHYSGFTLPVYKVVAPDGTIFIMSSIFHGWTISVLAEKPIEVDFIGLFDPNCSVPIHHCFGFPEDKVYGSYTKNNMQFTIELPTDNHAWTFFYLYAHNVLGNRNKSGSGR